MGLVKQSAVIMAVDTHSATGMILGLFLEKHDFDCGSPFLTIRNCIFGYKVVQRFTVGNHETWEFGLKRYFRLIPRE